jgi:hypothetical protein
MKVLTSVFSKVKRSWLTRMNVDYESAVKEEITSFKTIEDMHGLPDIFHYWSHTYLLPHLIESGFLSIDEFFTKNLMESSVMNPVFASIGSGYCDTEIRIARLMLEKGLKSFTFECIDLNPHLLQRGKELADSAGLTEYMRFTVADLNEWQPEKRYAGIMANHSLHHVVNLEGLFNAVQAALDDSGAFVATDMIGRNGHQRWPEALEIVHRFWRELPDAYRYNHQLQRHEPEFANWDCSSEGFEGIRAQDILPLLVQRFSFAYFYGFANVVGPFIDRSFGHNFDAAADWDRAFVDRLHAADEAGFASGQLKPTQMFAVMKKTSVHDPVYVRGLSPEASVRRA